MKRISCSSILEVQHQEEWRRKQLHPTEMLSYNILNVRQTYFLRANSDEGLTPFLLLAAMPIFQYVNIV
jgi:hypothetical protein